MSFDYDKFYKDKGAFIHDDPVRFSFISSLCSGRVLDFACGSGSLADYYHGDYFGFDISPIAISLAKEVRRKTAKFECSDAFSLDIFKDQKFDTIILGQFLEHINDIDMIIKNLIKLSHSETRWIISVPNGDRVPDPSHCQIFTIPILRKIFRKYGKVRFYNWGGAKQRIIMSVDYQKKNDDLFSLVMILKNEEKGLETAIFSCLDFVDNIILAVDSKSTDNTEKIARLYADEFKIFEWKDDFSLARNEAEKNVKTPWILVLDGHEYVKNKGDLEKALSFDCDGLLVQVQMENGSGLAYPRIYKSGLGYTGKVHNLVNCKKVVNFPAFLIIHDRQGLQTEKSNLERKKQRDKMVPEIMNEKIKKDPKDSRAYLHLAFHYHGKNEFQKAISLYKKVARFSNSPDFLYSAFFNIGFCYLFLGKPFRAWLSTRRANKIIPDRWETAKLYGLIFAAAKSYKKAIQNFVLSFNGNKKQYLFSPLPRDNIDTWDLIGQCFFNLGNIEEAICSFQRALESCSEKDKKMPSTNIKYSRYQMLEKRVSFLLNSLPSFSSFDKKSLPDFLKKAKPKKPVYSRRPKHKKKKRR